MTTHQFSGSLRQGQAGEAQLDQFFGRYWAIQPATVAQQRQEIDRNYYDLHTKQFAFTVEYKFDQKAHSTGNAFIELISSDTTGQLGWALQCSADRLFYCVEGNLLVYVLDPARVRRMVSQWVRTYQRHGLRVVENRGIYERYNTIGLLLPLRELEAIAEQVVSM